jgi:hypothetical protein
MSETPLQTPTEDDPAQPADPSEATTTTSEPSQTSDPTAPTAEPEPTEPTDRSSTSGSEGYDQPVIPEAGGGSASPLSGGSITPGASAESGEPRAFGSSVDTDAEGSAEASGSGQGSGDVLGADTPGQASTTVKDPSDWVTGDEPMTGAQRSYLDTLARAAGEQLPADLNKAQASEHIDRLQAKTGRGAS